MAGWRLWLERGATVAVVDLENMQTLATFDVGKDADDAC